MSRSCKEVTDREVSREIIKVLSSVDFESGDWTILKILKYISKKLDCKLGEKGSVQYERFRGRVKTAVQVFNDRDEDPDAWEDFKKKYKKTSKLPLPRKKSKSPSP